MLPQFSDDEKEILRIIGRRKMTIQDISSKFYRCKEVPLADRNYIACVIRRVNAKCSKNKSSWVLVGEGSGRGGRVVWKGKRRTQLIVYEEKRLTESNK